MSATARACWLAAALCLLVIALDQVAKGLVEANLVPGEEVDVLGPLGLTLTHNSGVAFGVGGGSGAPMVILPLLGLGFVAYIFLRDPGRPGVWVAIGLIGGGALGNLIDRVRAGAVTDFIDLPSWPAFNIADIAVCCGVALLVLLYLREGDGARARA